MIQLWTYYTFTALNIFPLSFSGFALKTDWSRCGLGKERIEHALTHRANMKLSQEETGLWEVIMRRKVMGK